MNEIQCIYVDNGTFIVALWATRHTEDVKGNQELHVKTTLRELIVYLVFLAILCIGMGILLTMNLIALQQI